MLTFEQEDMSSRDCDLVERFEGQSDQHAAYMLYVREGAAEECASHHRKARRRYVDKDGAATCALCPSTLVLVTACAIVPLYPNELTPP